MIIESKAKKIGQQSLTHIILGQSSHTVGGICPKGSHDDADVLRHSSAPLGGNQEEMSQYTVTRCDLVT